MSQIILHIFLNLNYNKKVGTIKLRLIWNEPSFPTKILNGMLHNTHSIWGESQHSVAKSTNMLNFVSEYVTGQISAKFFS